MSDLQQELNQVLEVQSAVIARLNQLPNKVTASRHARTVSLVHATLNQIERLQKRFK